MLPAPGRFDGGGRLGEKISRKTHFQLAIARKVYYY
jgi:hypothetical protein